VRDRYSQYFEQSGTAVELAGPLVRLRYPRLDDASRILELLRDPEVPRHFLWEPPRDLEEAQEYVSGFQHEVYRQWAYHFAVIGGEAKDLIGVANLYHIDRLAREAEIGIWLGRAYWGQGVQSEVSRLLIEFGFQSLGLRRIIFQVAVENTRAQAAFRKLGATERGRVQLFSRRQNRMVEHRVYGLEAAGWPAAS
jgi:[ribosomal protein S5]-alanine N-acetyltransferase